MSPTGLSHGGQTLDVHHVSELPRLVQAVETVHLDGLAYYLVRHLPKSRNITLQRLRFKRLLFKRELGR